MKRWILILVLGIPIWVPIAWTAKPKPPKTQEPERHEFYSRAGPKRPKGLN